MNIFLPPAYVVRREGTVFTGVCLSTGGGRGGSGPGGRGGTLAARSGWGGGTLAGGVPWSGTPPGGT